MTTTLDVVREVEQLRHERDHYKDEFLKLRDQYLQVEAGYRQLKVALKKEKCKSDHYMVAHAAMYEAIGNAHAMLRDAAERAQQAPYAPLPSPPRENGDEPQDLDEQRMVEGIKEAAQQAITEAQLAEAESVKRIAKKFGGDNNGKK